MLHYILTSLSDPIPNVFANGELSERLTKAIKHHYILISKKGGITALRIEDLAKNVVEHIVIGFNQMVLPSAL